MTEFNQMYNISKFGARTSQPCLAHFPSHTHCPASPILPHPTSPIPQARARPRLPIKSVRRAIIAVSAQSLPRPVRRARSTQTWARPISPVVYRAMRAPFATSRGSRRPADRARAVSTARRALSLPIRSCVRLDSTARSVPQRRLGAATAPTSSRSARPFAAIVPRAFSAKAMPPS